MRAAAAIIALGLVALPSSVSAAGDVEQGRALAERVCKRCHVIGEDNLHGGIGSTPSFFLMSEKLDGYRFRILSVTRRRPHIAQELDLSRDELEDVLAYIQTLERP